MVLSSWGTNTRFAGCRHYHQVRLQFLPQWCYFTQVVSTHWYRRTGDATHGGRSSQCGQTKLLQTCPKHGCLVMQQLLAVLPHFQGPPFPTKGGTQYFTTLPRPATGMALGRKVFFLWGVNDDNHQHGKSSACAGVAGRRPWQFHN